MVTNLPDAPTDACPEADMAALLVMQARAEAQLVRADLRHRPLRELAPEPAETAIPVDDMLNPFTTPVIADRYLRRLRPSDDVVHLLPAPRQTSWEQHAGYIEARTFRVVSQAGTTALPGLRVFGSGDGLSRTRRADEISACLRDRHPLAVISPIDSMTRFLAIDGEDRYASAAIVARSLHHVAVAVAAGPTTAVGTHHMALISHGDDQWIPASDLPYSPVLPGSIAAPINAPGTAEPQARTLFPGCGNPVLLHGIILGGIEAAYQPDFWPCDGAALYIAVAAGRATMKTQSGKRLLTPYQVQALLVNALRKGKKVPGLITARDELAARRLLTYLRQCGIA